MVEELRNIMVKEPDAGPSELTRSPCPLPLPLTLTLPASILRVIRRGVIRRRRGLGPIDEGDSPEGL